MLCVSLAPLSDGIGEEGEACRCRNAERNDCEKCSDPSPDQLVGVCGLGYHDRPDAGLGRRTRSGLPIVQLLVQAGEDEVHSGEGNARLPMSRHDDEDWVPSDA